MEPLKPKERLLLSHFRKNARESLTTISKQTRVPVSTIFDRLKHYERSFIRKHTALLDFSQLGYMIRANLLLKVAVEDREQTKRYLSCHESVNSLFKVNNGFDYLAEMVFRNIRELEDFIEAIERKFRIEDKTVFYIIEDICREQFLAEPELARMAA